MTPNKQTFTPYSGPPFKHTHEPPEAADLIAANKMANEIIQNFEPEQHLEMLEQIRKMLIQNIRDRMDEQQTKIQHMRNDLETMLKKNESLGNVLQEI